MPRLPHLRDTTARLLSHVCEQTDWLDHRSEVAMNVRAAAAVLEAAEFLRTEDKRQGRAALALLDPLIGSDTSLEPAHLPLLSGLRRQIRSLLAEPAWTGAPWLDVQVPEDVRAVPTMLTEPTMRFYTWLGGQLAPEPRVAELGSWLGSSTRCLCAGLDAAAPETGAGSVDVYDSFTWAAWMDQHLPLRADLPRPRPGEGFLSLFQTNVAACLPRVVAHPCWIDAGVHPGELPTWPHPDPIDLLVYDMGPDRHVLDLVWAIFSPHLEPGVTVLVFNEYGKVHAGAIWQFCADHAGQLRAEYKPEGTAKAFRYG